MTETNVSTITPEVSAMLADIALPRTLYGGTKAMRAAGKTYLPKEAAESEDSYRDRLSRSTLFNAFGKTVKDMAGRVFAKELALGKDAPTKIAEWCENVDMTGRNLSVFARDVFTDALQTGVSYILVDMAKKGENLTRADEISMGLRPYLIDLKVEDIIGWRAEAVNGKVALTQLRIFESITEPSSAWAATQTKQIRVLSPYAYQVWRQNDKKDWYLFDEGTRELAEITLAPVYTNRTGFMQGLPPLQDLADLNVAHWQSSSDQRSILHVARVPILFASGVPETASLVIGSSAMTRATDPNASLQFVEHSGAAIASGREDIKELEFQMQAMGLQLLASRTHKTVVGEVRDDVRETSPLAAMAGSLKDALENALTHMAKLGGLGDDGGSVDINKEFGAGSFSSVDLQTLMNAVNTGLIARRTFWGELKRRGVLSDSFDEVAEEEALSVQA